MPRPSMTSHRASLPSFHRAATKESPMRSQPYGSTGTISLLTRTSSGRRPGSSRPLLPPEMRAHSANNTGAWRRPASRVTTVFGEGGLISSSNSIKEARLAQRHDHRAAPLTGAGGRGLVDAARAGASATAAARETLEARGGIPGRAEEQSAM